MIWLRQFVGYATTKKAVYEALNFDSPMFAACIELIHRAGEPLLKRAQEAGKARADVDFADDARGERVLAMALDGIKTQT